MTDEEREQVVELLRCAADEDFATWTLGGYLNGQIDAAEWLGVSAKVENLAIDAYRSIEQKIPREPTRAGGLNEQYRTGLLNAALLVEEGSWP